MIEKGMSKYLYILFDLCPVHHTYYLTKNGLINAQIIEKETIWNNQKLKTKGITLMPIYVTNRKRLPKGYKPTPYEARFGFFINDGLKDDKLAQRFADTVIALISLIHGAGTDEQPIAFGLPRSKVRNGNIIRWRDILLEDEQKPYEEQFGEFELYNRLGKSLSLPGTEKAWSLAPFVMDNSELLDAAHFYQASIHEYHFLGDSISEVLLDLENAPKSKRGSTMAEDALQNAFKAIEAIIGEPPTDERKLRKKMIDVGLNPDEKVGWQWFGSGPGLEPIIAKIRKIHNLRDKKSAHGKTIKNRKITFYNLMDSQGCARTVILRAIEKVKGSGLNLQQNPSKMILGGSSHACEKPI